MISEALLFSPVATTLPAVNPTLTPNGTSAATGAVPAAPVSCRRGLRRKFQKSLRLVGDDLDVGLHRRRASSRAEDQPAQWITLIDN